MKTMKEALAIVFVAALIVIVVAICFGKPSIPDVNIRDMATLCKDVCGEGRVSSVWSGGCHCD